MKLVYSSITSNTSSSCLEGAEKLLASFFDFRRLIGLVGSGFIAPFASVSVFNFVGSRKVVFCISTGLYDS